MLASLLWMMAAAAQPTPPAADIYQPGREVVADLNRIVTPNGVQETFEATLGGARQVVNVRGADRDNPILIYVHGGPGAVEMPFAWAFQRPWEDFFTVVQWDQRGAGRSFPLNDPKGARSDDDDRSLSRRHDRADRSAPQEIRQAQGLPARP